MTSEKERNNERLFILEMIDSGKISAEEGLRLLQVLPEAEENEADAGMEVLPPDASLPDDGNQGFYQAETVGLADLVPAVADEESWSASKAEAAQAGDTPHADGPVLSGEAIPAPAQGTAPPDFARWRRFWTVPFWIGVGVTVLGAILMYQAQMSAGVSFWFLCAAVPFTLGVLLLTLAWQSRTSRWLHLRVQQPRDAWPRVIAISFPLPLGLAGWAMRTFGVRLPGMEAASVDDLLQAIQTSTSPENPLYVEVEDEEDGEKVQIYIG